MFEFTKEQRRKFKKIKYLKKGSFGKNKIVLEFDNITRMFRRKKTFIGDFTIEIKFGEYNRHVIKVINSKPILTRSPYSDRFLKLHHPHVYIGDNHPCLGYTRKSIIIESIKRQDYVQVILQMYQFLKTYTGNDCYQSLNYWAKANTNEKGERIYDGTI